MTFQNVIDLLKDRFFDLTDEEAMSIINRVHRGLYAHFPEIAKGSVPITLVENTKEYAVAGLSQIESVTIAGRPLTAEYVSELNKRNPDWRSEAAGSAESYYVTVDGSGHWNVGFHPTPNSAGTALAWGAKGTGNVTPSDKIADVFPSEAIYVEGASAEAAKARRPSAVALYVSLFEEAKGSARSFIETMTGDRQTSQLNNARK